MVRCVTPSSCGWPLRKQPWCTHDRIQTWSGLWDGCRCRRAGAECHYVRTCVFEWFMDAWMSSKSYPYGRLCPAYMQPAPNLPQRVMSFEYALMRVGPNTGVDMCEPLVDRAALAPDEPVVSPLLSPAGPAWDTGQPCAAHWLAPSVPDIGVLSNA